MQKKQDRDEVMLDQIRNLVDPSRVPYSRERYMIDQPHNNDVDEKAGEYLRFGEKTPGPSLRPEEWNRYTYQDQQIGQYSKKAEGSEDRAEIRQPQIHSDNPQIENHQEGQSRQTRERGQDLCYLFQQIQRGTPRLLSSSLSLSYRA